jgi:predicted ATPase/Tfp pilus assembly protein PilF
MQVDGAPVDVSRLQKPLALLAYLATENRLHTRGALATLFWPDAASENALRNLRQLLHRLRRAIRDAEAEPPHLLSTAQTLQFNAESDAWVDVAAFEALVNETQQHRHRRLSACPVCIAKLETAVAHYRGPLLDGLDVAGSGPFEEWVLIRREYLHQRASAALHAVAEYRLAHGQWEQAQRYARRLLRFDPWDEAAERLLLRALAMRKGRNAALLEYRRFQQVLAAQLGVEPEDETLMLVAKIRSGKLSAALYRPADEALPQPGAPFIGREAEQSQLHAYLAHRGHRLITVLGPGGSGKTRLALHAAAEQAPDWRDGVQVVLLADVATSAQLEDALTAALPINATGTSSRLAHLLDYLREKELLLLLDNFEHLLACPDLKRDGAPLLQEILHHAPRVKLLITSRARLNVPEEWIIQLDGLSFPDNNLTRPLAMQYSAVQLFAHHARRVYPGWSLQPENLPHVLRICQLIAGLPLGIELAAAWARGFSCRQIADEIERNLDFLRQAQPHGPARQQSLRATFDYSYALLSEAERRLLRKLSIFRAGFDKETAQRVADADPPTLTALQDKSLLQTSSAGRWALHPLLQRYAAERLAAYPDEEQETQTRHSHFYTTFLQRQEAPLVGEHPEKALAAIGVEMGNTQAAWNWAVGQNNIQDLGQSAIALSRFYELRGLFHQGEETFGNAAERVLTSDKLGAIKKPDRKTESVAARLLVEQAHFLIRRAMYQRAIQIAQQAITLAQSAQDVHGEAAGYLRWGMALRHQGNYREAHPLLERAVGLARTAASASWLEAESLRTLGAVSWKQSNYAKARAYLEQALQVDREIGDRRGEGWTHNNLGLVAENEGDYGKAIGYYEQALSTSRGIGYRWGESIALGNLGYIHARVGDYARAKEYYRQDLRICRELGDQRGENWTLGYLGLLSHQQGNDRDGLKYSQQALTISQEIGDQRRQAHDRTHLGHALTGLERLPEAARAYRQALELRRELDDYPLAMETLAGLIRLSLAQGDVSSAHAWAEEILAYLAAHNVERTDESARIYLACYRALRASGDPRAQEILTTVYRRLQERAAKITGETLRRSFLANVAVHREIVKLFEGEE